jgi:hypothetical protein
MGKQLSRSPDDSTQRAGAGGHGDQGGAGINRHRVADERAAQERSSAPFWLRVMRLGPKDVGEALTGIYTGQV